MRIGTGYDAHKLTEGRRLVLGGVNVPHTKGLLGHSDADCLTHAVMDALLGAAGCGDIGTHFPPSDESYKDIYSIKLLEKTVSVIKEKGYEIENIDSVIIAQKPKLAAYIPQMCDTVAAACGIKREQVSIKATTTEYMGFEGREEGIAAIAVCLLNDI